jgi:hypothetical protein
MVSGDKRPDDLVRGVRRRIVDEDHLVGLASLGDDALEQVGQISSVAETRNHHREGSGRLERQLHTRTLVHVAEEPPQASL